MSKPVLINFALFVDGQGYIGKVKEIEQPKLAPKTIDYMAGGMAAPLKLPMGVLEPMDTSFTLIAYDLTVLKHFGLVPGKTIPLTARGAVCAEDGEVKPMTIVMRGHVVETEPGTWKPGEENNIKVALSLTYYKVEQAGEVVFEADAENMVLNVGGNDQLAAVRAALGI